MSDEQAKIKNTDYEGGRTLTAIDLEAIRETVFKTVPVEMMDTQKLVTENRELRAERNKLREWVDALVSKVKRDPS